MKIQEEQPFERSTYPIRKILLYNFLGGIAWGLGLTVGLGILFAIFGFILSQINLIPIVGTFINDVVEYVLQSNPRY